jgi:peroxiredoxin Q/BCP
MSASLQPGSPAPAFDLPTDGGGHIRLADLKGQRVILYFYPKDDTTGCTREAIDFTAAAKTFKKKGAVVVGVSKDSVKAHDKFKAKHQLDVILASDEDGKIVERYGAWVQKSMYGRTYMGIDRSTFLIDGSGVIRQIWRKVRVPGHVDEVAAALDQTKA